MRTMRDIGVLLMMVGTTLLWGNGGEASDGIDLDYASLFNERGFYHSAAVDRDGNELISEYAGNLSLSLPLFRVPVQGGGEVALDLVYSGSMGYSIVNENSGVGGQSRDWISLSAPGWLLAVNGVPVLTLNFESAWLSRGYEVNGIRTARNGGVSLLTNGYHFTDNVGTYSPGGADRSLELPDRNIISLLRGDGGVINLVHPHQQVNPGYTHGFTGEFRADDLFGREKALVWVQSVQSDPLFDVEGRKDRNLSLFRGDGTVVDYGEQHTALFLGDYQGPDVAMQQFIPRGIRDNLGNTIRFLYRDWLIPPDDPNVRYAVPGHPLIEQITLPGHDEAIRIEYQLSRLYETLSGITIRFGEREYRLMLEDADGGSPHFPFVPQDDWPAERRLGNIPRDGGHGALGMVTRLIDPEGREYRFEYDGYRRRFDIQNPLAHGYRPALPGGRVLDHAAPQRLEVRLARLAAVRYPEGRRSEFVYFEDGPGRIGGFDLEDWWRPTMAYSPPGDWYLGASPYLCDRDGRGGIGRDCFAQNVVAERTVFDDGGHLPRPVRRDRFEYGWSNVHRSFNPWGMPGYRGIDYADRFWTVHRQAAFDGEGRERSVRSDRFEYRSMPYRNIPKVSQDMGSRILLKQVETRDGSGVLQEKREVRYHLEGRYIANEEPFFHGQHLEKTAEEWTVYHAGRTLSAGTERWRYTLAADGLTFSQIRHTDRLGITTVRTFSEEFLVAPGTLRQDSYYHVDRPLAESRYPDSLNTAPEDALSRTQTEYYTEVDRGAFQFWTLEQWRPDPRWHPDSVLYRSLPNRLQVGYRYEEPTLDLVAPGETRQEAYVGFRNGFPSPLRERDGSVQSAVLRLYVTTSSGPVDTHPIEVDVLQEPWDPLTVSIERPAGTERGDRLTVRMGTWLDVDLTDEFRRWRDEGRPFHGVRLRMEGDPAAGPAQYGAWLETDRYHPDHTPHTMASLVVRFAGGEESVYRTYNGFPEPVGGMPGQVRARREARIASGQDLGDAVTRYRYYLYEPFGNLYDERGPGGYRREFRYDADGIFARTREDGVSETGSLAWTHPALPVRHRILPDTLRGESLTRFTRHDRFGLPLNLVGVAGEVLDVEWDRLSRLRRVVRPLDFTNARPAWVRDTIAVAADSFLEAGHWRDSRRNPPDSWTYARDRLTVQVRSDVAEGRLKTQSYLDFSGLAAHQLRAVTSVKLHLYCERVRDHIPGAMQVAVLAVTEDWDTRWDDPTGPPSRGGPSSILATVRDGWNTIDLSGWMPAILNDDRGFNGLCLVGLPGEGVLHVERGFGTDSGLAPWLEIAGERLSRVEQGFSIRHDYDDAANRLVRQEKQRRDPGSGALLAARSEFDFDGLDRLVWKRRFDAEGEASHESWDFDGTTRVVRHRNANGNDTRFDYDYQGRLTETTFADGTEKGMAFRWVDGPRHSYGPLETGEMSPGPVLSVEVARDELGQTVHRYADLAGNLRQEVVDSGGLDLATNYYYNGLGHLIRVEKPEEDMVRYERLSSGRIRMRTTREAGTVRYRYDRAGNRRFVQTAAQAARAEVRFTTYDGLGRPLATGLLRGVALDGLDPDRPGRMESDPATMVHLRHYDGKPDWRLPPWVTIREQVDGLSMGRLAGRLAAVAVRTAPDNDGISLPEKGETDPAGDWQFELFDYDARGRIAARHVLLPGLPTMTIRNTWDSRDQLVGRHTAVGDQTFAETFVRDRLGRIEQVLTATDGGEALPALAYRYLPTDALSAQSVGREAGRDDETWQARAYDRRERLAAIGDPGDDRFAFAARYHYRDDGTLRQAEERTPGDPENPAFRYAYAYDRSGRLTGADFSYAGLPTALETDHYDVDRIAYDGNGNLLSLRRRDDRGRVIDDLRYGYGDDDGRLRTVTERASRSAAAWDAESTALEYDADGNVRAMRRADGRDITAIDWNWQGRPVSLTAPGGRIAYAYNGAGWRTMRHVGDSRTDVYLRDGERLVAELDERGRVRHWNLWGVGLAGRVMPDGERHFYLRDRLGSIRAVVDEAGRVLESHDYYPFGLHLPGRDLRSGEGTRERFTGKERDTESGWDYFGARYYDPALGRWLAVDPRHDDRIWESPYSYAGNSPINRIDPDGEFWHIVGGAAIGAVVGGGMDYLNQVSGGDVLDFSNYDFSAEIDWRSVGAAATEGAINGTVIAATGGQTLLAAAAGNAAGGIVGGMAKRAVNGDQVVNGIEIMADGISGGIGGGAANLIEKQIASKSGNLISRVLVQRIGANATDQIAKKAAGATRGAVKSTVRKAIKEFEKTVRSEKDN